MHSMLTADSTFLSDISDDLGLINRTPDTMPPTHTATLTYSRIVILPGENSVSSSTEVEFGIPVMRTPAGDRLYLSNGDPKTHVKSSLPASVECPGHRISRSDFSSSARFQELSNSSTSEGFLGLPDKIATFIKADRERKCKTGREAQVGEVSEDRLDWQNAVHTHTIGSTIAPTRRSYAEILTRTGTHHTKSFQGGPKRKLYVQTFVFFMRYFFCHS